MTPTEKHGILPEERTMGVAKDIAARINALKYEDFPAEARHWAKIAVADTLGCALAGSLEETAKIPARVLGAGQNPGASLVWGTDTRTRPLDAALINGTAAHAFDFDDCNESLGGHPSAPVMPGALAIGEEIGVSGRDFIEAYIAGFETETRIARGVHFHHYTKGWHPTATLGTFGSVAACGRLLKLDDDTLATALSIAVSLAAGVKANFGTMTKPLHVGLTARNGLFACLMAKEGFSANPEAFEHGQGFFEVYNGAGTYNVDKILADWGKPLDIVSPGVAIKQHPCCGSAHPAVDAAIAVFDKHHPAFDQIAKVETSTHEIRLQHTDRPDPRGELAAKFSVQYCVLRGLKEGKVILEHFENEAYMDKDIRALLPKVAATAYTGDNSFLGTVTVTMKDGTVYEETAETALGRGPENPLTAEQLKQKFIDCAVRAIPKDRAERLHALIWDIDAVKSVREITDAMTASSGAAKAAE
ncbi:MAG: MmgE/PrpD family protein [Rhodospirillales bacterium]